MNLKGVEQGMEARNLDWSQIVADLVYLAMALNLTLYGSGIKEVAYLNLCL